MFGKRLFLLFFLLAVGVSLAAAPVPYDFFPIGTKALAAGGAFVAQADDLAAIAYNPAGLFQLEKRHITYQLYSILKINRLVDTSIKLRWEYFPLFAVSFPVYEGKVTGSAYFSTLFKSFLESYSVHVLGSAFSWKINDVLAVGLDAGLAIGNQSNNWTAGFHLQAGVLLRLGPTLKAGASFRFPLRLSWDYLRSDNDVEETLPWCLRGGVAWRVAEGTIITFDLEWQGIQDIRYTASGVRQDPGYQTGLFKNLHPHFGIQYFQPTLGAWLRCGLMTMATASTTTLETQPMLTLGIGAFTSKFFKIDFSLLDSLIFDIFSRTNRYERFLISFEYTF